MKQMNMMINLATNFINLIFNMSDNTSPAIHLNCGNAIEQWIIVSIAPIDSPFWVNGNRETPFISNNDCICNSTQLNHPNLVLYGVLIHPLCCTRIADVMVLIAGHDDVIKWKHFPRYWPCVRGIHRWPVDSLHKGQSHGTSMFYLICAYTNV